MSRIVYATASVRGGILQRSVQCRRGVIGQFNQAVSPFCSSSQPKMNNASVSDIPKLGGEDLKDTSNHNGWDYDILVNGGGIVGITFVAKVLQKTSNILRIGSSRSTVPLLWYRRSSLFSPYLVLYLLATATAVFLTLVTTEHIERHHRRATPSLFVYDSRKRTARYKGLCAVPYVNQHTKRDRCVETYWG